MRLENYKTVDNGWKAGDGRGNHRITVYASEAEYALVKVCWRRRDHAPENIGLRIFPEESEKEIKDIFVCEKGRDCAQIVFRAPKAGVYYIYYMPYVFCEGYPWYAPKIQYLPAEDMKPDLAWKASFSREKAVDAEIKYIEARTDFDSFWPMEVPMTADERNEFEGKEEAFYLVAESRTRSVRMSKELPAIWLGRDNLTLLEDNAYKNEHYVFQAVLCACADIGKITVKLLIDGEEIDDCDTAVCFNTTGVDWLGQPFSPEVSVNKGCVQPLWCGVKLEKLSPAESHKLEVLVSANNCEKKITIILRVIDGILPRNGDNDLWRLSRLFWLNSTIGIDKNPQKDIRQ